MLTQGMDMAQASLASGISTDPKLGEGEGLIGVLRHTHTLYEYDATHTLYCCIPFVRLAQHLALTPGVLSRGRVRRLEYTVGAITNALFFAENEGWY